MKRISPVESITPNENAADASVPANHGVLDNENVAAHDEVEHEAALRDSALRPPR